MAKASDNPFPSILVAESAAPAAPPSGHSRLFIDPVDGALKRINSAGTVTAIASSTAASRVYAHRGTTQSIPHNVSTAIDLTGEDYDTDNFHDTVTNTSRLTIPAGWTSAVYAITGSVQVASNATGMRTLTIRKNGAALSRGAGQQKANAPMGGVALMQVSADVQLTAGDYVDLAISQTSGAALDVASATLSLRRV